MNMEEHVAVGDESWICWIYWIGIFHWAGTSAADISCLMVESTWETKFRSRHGCTIYTFHYTLGGKAQITSTNAYLIPS